MNKTLSLNNWPIFAFLLSLSLWLGALGFEHIGGMQPCQMCYWQRHAHKLVLVFSGLALFVRFYGKTDKYNKFFVLLISLAFLLSFGLAFWHSGVEYKWWEGPKTCSGGGGVVSGSAILEALNSKPKMPSCGDVPWSLFGISMAGYNALISLGASLISFALLFGGRNE